MLHQEPTTVSSNIILVSFPSLFTQHQSAQHGAWDTALCIVKCAMCYPRCHAEFRTSILRKITGFVGFQFV